MSCIGNYSLPTFFSPLGIGVLCGNCGEGLGVSALLNECVTCSDASGLLIAGLSMLTIWIT